MRIPNHQLRIRELHSLRHHYLIRSRRMRMRAEPELRGAGRGVEGAERNVGYNEEGALFLSARSLLI